MCDVFTYMSPSGLPTGTVSSGRPGSSAGPDRDRSSATDPQARIAELERENEALRAAVERQRRENDRIVDRYEQLLERERTCGPAERTADDSDTDESGDPGVLDRIARLLDRA